MKFSKTKSARHLATLSIASILSAQMAQPSFAHGPLTTDQPSENPPLDLSAPSVLLETHGPLKAQNPKPKEDVPNKLNKIAPDFTSSEKLTPLGEEMANLIRVREKIHELHVANRKLENSNLSDEERDDLEHDSDHLSSEVAKRILKASLEVDFVLSEIAYELGLDQYLLSQLSNKQDRHILMANKLDAVSNAVLWSLSSALAIPGFRNARMTIPAGITGIIAGAVPSSLELVTLQIPVREKLRTKPETNMLSFIFDLDSSKDYYLPNTVKKYLKSIPPHRPDIRSRREQLLTAWTEAGKIPPRQKEKAFQKTVCMLTGTYDFKKDKLSVEILENRMLMLNHLRVTIYTMKRGLFELISEI